MGLQQIVQETGEYLELENDNVFKQKWSSIPRTSDNTNGCFECNICLDTVQDPVTTLCGHLYCWPCIYKWLHVQNSSHKQDEHQHKCPVCRAEISSSSLVPLYGRVASSSEDSKPYNGLVIPRRPLQVGLPRDIFQSPSQTFRHQQPLSSPYRSQATAERSSHGHIVTNKYYNPTISMFIEMVYPGIFESSDTSLFAYPNYRPSMRRSSGSPRVRRQEKQIDKSLNRVSIFLFCSLILCLLLF